MNIRYKIELHSYWHCSSGQAAGADLDSLVVKTREKLPYIPGKTLKGLIRDAIAELKGWIPSDTPTDEELTKLLGYTKDADNKAKAEAFFTDAVLDHAEAAAITAESLQSHLYTSIASTAIDTDGIAKDSSLRKIEVCVPCTLYASIYDAPDSLEDTLCDALKYIKSLGSHRNRGLGRCTFTIIEKGDSK